MVSQGEEPRRVLEALFRTAVASVEPGACTLRYLRVRGGELHIDTPQGQWRLALPLGVFGAGKAVAHMAAAVEQLLPKGAATGLVIATPETARLLGTIALRTGGHPVPNEHGLAATGELMDLAHQRGPGGTLFLLSGGASSLLVAPRPPLHLTHKVRVNELLLRSGASIQEVNTVRKHLSRVKGGQLLRVVDGPVVTLAISDVLGDDPGVIGSAPTYPDPTTYAEAEEVLRRYGLLSEVPSPVRSILIEGKEGRLPETVKPTDPEAARVGYSIVARNCDALQAVCNVARQRGWVAELYPQPLQGESAAAARSFASFLQAACARRSDGPRVVVAGGETTVTVRGTGKGGRNQEFALALAQALDGLPVCVLSAGTDGIDGPTDAAGAFVDGTTIDRARARGIDPSPFLDNNDSYTFFSQLGDLFCPGPTGTNVMDIVIAILGPQAS